MSSAPVDGVDVARNNNPANVVVSFLIPDLHLRWEQAAIIIKSGYLRPPFRYNKALSIVHGAWITSRSASFFQR